MATTPQGPVQGAQIPGGGGLDEALNSLTVDDMLSGLTPEDIAAQQQPQAQPDAAQAPAQAAGASGGPAGVPTSGIMPSEAQAQKQAQDVMASAALGVAKAGFELKDLFAGEPAAKDRSAVRQWIEEKAQGLRHDSVANGVAMGLTQFGVGFIGLGKIKYVAQGIEWAARYGKVAHTAAESARGAVAAAAVMDPHEERLSNLVQQYPALQNPITNYLAAKPEDSAAEGRLKNALEGIVMDGVLVSGLTLVTKSIRLARTGDIKGANEAAAQADEAFAKAANKPATPEAEAPVAPAAETAQPRLRLAEAPEGGVYTPEQLRPNEKYFKAYRPDGEVAAEIMVRLDGTTASIEDILIPAKPRQEGQNTLGPSEMRAILRQFQEAHPEVKTLTGKRVSGARRGGSYSLDGEPTRVEVNLREGLTPESHGVTDSTSSGGPGNVGQRLDASGGDAGGSAGVRSGDGAGAGAPVADVPVVGRPVPISPEEVAQSLERLKKDNSALISSGGREAAMSEGYRFKGGDDVNGMIPWQKLKTTEETQAWMGQIMDDQAEVISKARGGNAEGVLSDRAVEQMVQHRAKAWGENPAQLMGILQAAGKDAPKMAANMETSFLLANKAFQDSYELAVRINSENFSGFASREEAVKALQERVGMATAMYANGKAILSNSARSLRRMQGQFQFTDAHLASLQGSDPEAVLRLVTDTNGDPQLLAKAARISLFNRIADPIASMQAANLLWGWKTQVVNFATSAAQLVWRPLETGVGSLVQRSLAGLRGDEEMIAQANSIRQQSIREVAYIGSNLSDGMAASVKAFIEGDSILLPHGQEHFTPSLTAMKQDNLAELAQMWKPITNVEDLWHNAFVASNYGKNAVLGSLRLLGAADEFVKTVRYRAIINAKASLEADAKGLEAGTEAYRDFISTKLDDAFDPTGRGIDKDALLEAQASTFQNDFVKPEMSLFGQGWAQGYSNFASKMTPARIITPFVKTPTNLFRYGVKLTPGVNLLQYEYFHALTGQAGAEGQARAMGQMTLGIGMVSSAATLWASGRLTGSGPQDVDQKKQWLSQGNRPFSIAWKNDKGEKQFFELSRFDPIGMPLTMVADTMALYYSGALRDEEQNGLATSMVLAFAHMMKDKTYLKNLNDALAALTDDKKMTSWVRRTAPGFMPFSSLMSGVNPDPVLHEVRTVMDSFIAKVPGWSASLAPQRDFLGDPIMVPQGFTQGEKNAGPLNNALNEIFQVTGKYISPASPRSQQTGGVDLRDFTMKNGRTAYDRYTELAGHPPGMAPLKDMLSKVVQSETYQKLPHGGPTENGTKAGMLMDVVKNYREAAWKRLIAENPDLRAATYQRRMDIAKAVATGAKDVKAVGDQGRVDKFNSLLKSYGLSLPSISIPPQ